MKISFVTRCSIILEPKDDNGPRHLERLRLRIEKMAKRLLGEAFLSLTIQPEGHFRLRVRRQVPQNCEVGHFFGWLSVFDLEDPVDAVKGSPRKVQRRPR